MAPLLNLRRWLKAVMDALGAMIRDGVSLARSVELTVQKDAILGVGPIGPVTREDFQLAGNGGVGESRRLVEDLHFGPERSRPKQQTTNNNKAQTGLCDRFFPVSPGMDESSWQPMVSAAQRRRQRRLRSWW